ncbi:hypothetical protein HNR46_003547 [Haloferula luteola]|uniref:Uncharacterized protein n=1 Tax=Haloferula luteola TaxID=595692 RepID=A0A840V5Q0_9BACT|nr:hypothetical protein [Haloferula luteola]MBB5353292.1 hypothetical protein [Haloferula luteola]
MIACEPEGFFSWNYRFRGEGFEGQTWHRVFGEKGGFEVNGVSYEVAKDGIWSGSWTVRHQGQVVGRGSKRNPFTRTFDLEWEGDAWVLSARGLGRAMMLQGPGGSLSFRPVHVFSRRVEVEGRIDSPAMIGWALWCAVTIWRRQAQSSS